MTRRRMSRATAGSPPAIPARMKAAAIDRFGPPSTLTLHDVPVPTPGPHEVLIAIETAGIGSWDASIRDGLIANYREYWNPIAFTAAMAGTRFDNSAK